MNSCSRTSRSRGFPAGLDVVVAPGVCLRPQAERVADRVGYLTQDFGRRLVRLTLQPFGDLLLEAVLALEAVFEAFQPAAVPILLLGCLQVGGDPRLGLTHPPDR